MNSTNRKRVAPKQTKCRIVDSRLAFNQKNLRSLVFKCGQDTYHMRPVPPKELRSSLKEKIVNANYQKKEEPSHASKHNSGSKSPLPQNLTMNLQNRQIRFKSPLLPSPARNKTLRIPYFNTNNKCLSEQRQSDRIFGEDLGSVYIVLQKNQVKQLSKCAKKQLTVERNVTKIRQDTHKELTHVKRTKIERKRPKCSSPIKVTESPFPIVSERFQKMLQNYLKRNGSTNQRSRQNESTITSRGSIYTPANSNFSYSKITDDSSIVQHLTIKSSPIPKRPDSQKPLSRPSTFKPKPPSNHLSCSKSNRKKKVDELLMLITEKELCEYRQNITNCLYKARPNNISDYC
ncbi:unnamed protein product [Moneuplotes crassus]|uniref:Uncharacterized protein n=1 Tax=Euplotes crassus TaxID=5936 RepID=A0AAD1UM01_EUPCR|nr:unnamed protein product [Moneuplotes crassus]